MCFPCHFSLLRHHIHLIHKKHHERISDIFWQRLGTHCNGKPRQGVEGTAQPCGGGASRGRKSSAPTATRRHGTPATPGPAPRGGALLKSKVQIRFLQRSIITLYFLHSLFRLSAFKRSSRFREPDLYPIRPRDGSA